MIANVGRILGVAFDRRVTSAGESTRTGNLTVIDPRTTERRIENRTARRIAIARKSDSLVPNGSPQRLPSSYLILAPFGTCDLSQERLDDLAYEPWVDFNLITVGSSEASAPSQQTTMPLERWIVYVNRLILFCMAIVWLPRLLGTEWGNRHHGTPVVVDCVLVALLALTWWIPQTGNVWKIIDELIPLWTIIKVIIAALLSAVLFVIYVEIVWSFNSTLNAQDFLKVTELVVFVGVAACLPALLYLLFTRQRLDPLLQRFFREVLVLDPTLRTIDEAQNKYAPLLDSIYGSGTVHRRRDDRQFRAGLPLVLSTVLILLGWIVTIDVFSDVTLLGEHRASFPVETLRYGFLGAYFFCLNMVFRRYVRADLSPKAYTHIAVRLLTTFALCVTIDLVPLPSIPHHLAGLLAFVVGLFPDTGIALVISTVKHALPDTLVPATQDDHPITDLQGMNLYDQARLLEEGIESVENLAHYNLVELMLRTRIPTPRIVDLFDQAILYLHLGSDNATTQQAMGYLRACGIRTATDLCSVYNAAQARDAAAHVTGDGDARGVLRLLDDLWPKVANRLRLVMDAFSDDEWLASVAYWRTMSANTEIVVDPEVFYGKSQPYTPASSQA